MPIPPARIDQLLMLALLVMLIVGCVVVLQPFLTALAWAVILCTTTWPLHQRVKKLAGGRAWVSALAMVVLLSLLMLAPFVIVGATIADNTDRMVALGQAALNARPPEPPQWLEKLPLLGATVAAYWESAAHDTAQLFHLLADYLDPLRKFALASGAALVNAVLQLALSIFIAWFIFFDGEPIVVRLDAATRRIAGRRGAELAELAATTVRGVVLGILGTALAQGAVAAIGFSIAGIGAAPLLGLLTFAMSPVPIGPPMVWIPAGLWLIHLGETGWGIFVLLWGTLVVSTIDNVIKPLIISRGSDLPFVLVLLGVLGGALAFGVIGVFLGPVLLAVGYALLSEYSRSASPADAASVAAPPATDVRPPETP